ncbi:hypothetical protein [Photorhabdus antumapuensis]|uniref:hypothetical protein n=1 Tax=Photorhabdus antumapuensis TaxID=2862867 RepID=UPI001CED7601|nr:hypothetical protein [Photorhabdus antumapuensis]MCA6222772.1 hypothetical protein [Photorhabdus antumapuensis]
MKVDIHHISPILSRVVFSLPTTDPVVPFSELAAAPRALFSACNASFSIKLVTAWVSGLALLNSGFEA